MTSKDKLEDPEGYQANVENICATYLSAPALHEQGAHIISTDEKTGMQALERVHPTKPTRPGLTERIEGSWSNVVGLPLERLSGWMAEIGIDLWDLL